MPGTVTVASKLPWPLRLQLQEAHEVSEQVHGGGVRIVQRWNKTGDTIVVKGCSVDRSKPYDREIVGGAALTHGVNADFWAKWLEQNKKFPPVVNGLIFAHEKPASVAAEAKDLAELKSGFEPVDPGNLPDEFKATVEELRV